MPDTETQTGPTPPAAAPTAAAAPTLAVIVNPEDTVGLVLQPAYISLGLAPELFVKEIGGTA
ncbi:hypothetical protein J8I87_41900 [Paraburkholderia sp. LEh10]|uniref:hypothetical protein n=1 Tax=Paraburkholderia sp. LEh10 TaxID=2821353 RepID=UPI001AE4378C|nr:hypothetical protein [Paraburkholderia sp. LEh10]MBP0596054.1 hypothetical protein [Paraburkholderia sp. LEh10]